MGVGDAYVFPGFLTPVLTQLFFPKPPTTFLTCFCRGERRRFPRKKSRPNRGSNSQPPSHESNILTTEPSRRVQTHKNHALFGKGLMTLKKKALENTEGKVENAGNHYFLLFPQCFLLDPREKLSFYQCLICHLEVLSIWSCPKFCLLVKG